MRASQFLIATVREIPSDAEIISHQLMVRAGLIRKLAAGIYSWLPMGLRVLRKVENIVREEMDRCGAQEMSMPMVQPAELWKESGRWKEYGPELLRLEDRHQRPFCLGPTHEEVITDLLRGEIGSYRQLPQTFYQIQTKFRDEVRPRFGIMRAREFLMKDAYSFHLDEASLQRTYDRMYAAYSAIFSRLGLEFRSVTADSGAIGGKVSQEFHVLADTGEDAIAVSDASDYAVNVEVAEALAPAGAVAAPSQPLQEVATPGQRSIEAVCRQLGIDADTTLKTLIVKGADPAAPLVALQLRGDHELSLVKAEKLDAVAAPLEFADQDTIRSLGGCDFGSLGPVGLQFPVFTDRAAAHLADFVCGANRDGYHLRGVNWERDCQTGPVVDLRQVVEGDPSPDGQGTLQIKRGIEVGHIFQLGTRYSEAMAAKVQDEQGRERSLAMGCYGIGVSRIVAAAIEQNHDANGIVWPEPIAPFQLAITAVNQHKSTAVSRCAEQLYQELSAAGVEVLLDDRNERPGVKFADMELLGIPHQLVVGERNLAQGKLEYRNRRQPEPQLVAQADIGNFLQQRLSHGSD